MTAYHAGDRCLYQRSDAQLDRPGRSMISIVKARLGRRVFLATLAVSAGMLSFAQGQEPDPSRVDADHLRQTLAIGSLSLLVSGLAAERIAIPKMKAFAQLEAAEQTTVVNVLLASLQGASASGDLTVPPAAEIEHRLAPLGRQVLGNMRALDNPTSFAREYFLLQNRVHQELLRLQEDYLRLGKNPGSLRVAKLVDAMTREHLLLLADIKGDVDSGKGATLP
jgi:putative membrane protein